MFISVWCYGLLGLHVYQLCIRRHDVCGWVEADQSKLKARRPRESQIDYMPERRTSQAEGP